MARCPYSPQHNSTALLTASGELYAATAMDFPGRDPAIYRSLGVLPPLRTAQYNSKWLNGKSHSHPRFPLMCLMLGYMVLKSKLTVLKKSKFFILCITWLFGDRKSRGIRNSVGRENRTHLIFIKLMLVFNTIVYDLENVMCQRYL